MKNNIFWHICGMNSWKYIVNDQINSLIDSNILSVIDNVYIFYLGNNKSDVDWVLKKNNKFILVQYSPVYSLYEKFCLDYLLDWSKHNSSNVFYFHAKGVSRPRNSSVWNWRKLMEHFLIYNYGDCIEKLKDNDAVGCLLTNGGNNAKIKDENHKYHFSGNFWWSKTDYIKTLPKIPNIDLSVNYNYWLCETWILYHFNTMKTHVVYDNDIKHYYDASPDMSWCK